MKQGKPNHGSGKTQFNRAKPKGASWTELRDKAIKRGEFKFSKKEEQQ